ncbi:MAG: AAA family ATPase [Erysipelotrichaceae bacterium]|nr:AAA family ATPase [Erysipelotrichaceae bacterium]
MKLLKKVLLINWHSFSKELIELGNINFLTGKNAVGKSTIVDAIQLVILGDTRGTSFNKAASEKSGRTVISYLKGEVGSDNEGNKKYLREGDFAAYVALEFFDDINQSPFVIGLQFDVSGEKLASHQFIYDGIIPEQCFITSNHAMDYKSFKEYITIAYNNVILPESLTTYKEEMRKKLGQLSQRFFALFKKAVPFQPIYDIRKFITEFVCDVKYDIKSDLEKMQENVRNYTSLEVEAKTIENKIYYLERIHSLYEAYVSDKNKCEQAQYLVDKLEIAKKKKEIVSINQQIESHNQRFLELSSEEASITADINSWNNVRDQLIVDKESNDAEVKHSMFTKQKDSINRDIDSVTEVFEKSATRLIHSFNEFKMMAQQIKEKTFDLALCQASGVDLSAIYSTADSIISKADVLEKLDANNLNKFSEDQIAELCMVVSSMEEMFSKVRNYSEASIQTYIEEKNNYLNTIASLRNGKKMYPRHLVEFKEFVEQTLSKRHNCNVEMNFVADLMEIRNKKWQSAIETYLYSNKFSFVIDEKYFKEAVSLYNDNRERFSDVAILDSSKIYERRNTFKVYPGSLVEEIETDNPYVQAYVNMLIGTMMKVDRIEDINKYDRGITSTGMLYQQFTARQLNLSRNKTPFIGKKATETQIEGYLAEIDEINSKMEQMQLISQPFYTYGRFNNLSAVDISYHYSNLMQIYKIDELKAQLEDINDKIESIDMTDVNEIQARIDEVDNEIRYANNSLRQNSQEKGSILTKIEDLKLVKLAQAQNSLAIKESEVANKYSQEWILNNVSEDMQEMLAYISEDQISRKLAESKRIADTLGAKRRSLERARIDYLTTFHVSIDTSDETNDKFDEELDKYKVITLPLYKEKIASAKEKSYEQFKEDLLSKLKASIESVSEQIDTLNVSLTNFKFGRDRYEFVVKPNPTYQGIYDMIMDELLMKDARTNSQAFYEKYKDTIDDFFAKLTEAPGANDEERREIIDKNISLYTDYRTYLDFDLLVLNSETNQVQSLAKSMNTKSGGETQTPFYISILASIANEYRINLTKEESNTPRLILFDEAFNKMDSERIKESIELLKRFGLQAILVAPPEKVSDIAPLVDRNLCVIRRRNNAFVKWFDKSDIEQYSTDR